MTGFANRNANSCHVQLGFHGSWLCGKIARFGIADLAFGFGKKLQPGFGKKTRFAGTDFADFAGFAGSAVDRNEIVHNRSVETFDFVHCSSDCWPCCLAVGNQNEGMHHVLAGFRGNLLCEKIGYTRV